MANHVHAYRSVIFYLLSVFPSHLRLLNGQAKVRCRNAITTFRGVRGSAYRPYTYVQTVGTRDRRHVASRRICPHIHVLCMPACVPMSAGSPHDDLHRSSNNYFSSPLISYHLLYTEALYCSRIRCVGVNVRIPCVTVKLIV